MTLNKILFAAMIAGLAIPTFAQEAVILPYPPPTPAYDALKKHLNLTDAQVTSLTTISKARNDAQTAVYNQINEKYNALNSLLNSNSTDSVRIGQLMIDINNLRKQTVPVEPYRSQALNLLTADQKTKLAPLVQALQLQNAAWQATSLNLIDNPSTIDPRALPVDFMGGIASMPVSSTPVLEKP